MAQESILNIPPDNLVLPFQLENSSLRGRVVRMNGVADEIISPQNYAPEIAQLTGEAAVITVLLSSMLKYEGSFTLQAQGDGVVKTLVSDITSEGELRACATYDHERLESAGRVVPLQEGESQYNNLAQLLGKGHMAFTVDQGNEHDRYQGIVDLKGKSMVECVHHYFGQSEQIGTGIKLAVGQRDGSWKAGAIMLQHLPEDAHNPEAGTGNVREDDWRRAMILMDSASDKEIFDTALPLEQLLFRLFHEEGVRVFQPSELAKGCRCYRDKLINVLIMMSEEDRADMVTEKGICLTCEFCNKDFVFDPDEFRRKI